ncbi:hypothetical protein BKA83DRAFT_4048500, partial [Pisolithus microcarpus]
VWLKKYLKTKNRPHWTVIADTILNNNITPKPIVKPKSHISWALQNWHKTAKKDTKIPIQLKEMIATARKYNIRLDTRQLSTQTLNKLPIWNHIAAENNYIWNKKSAKCLRNNHGIKTVGHLQHISNAPQCNNPQTCQNMAENLISKLPQKFNPLLQPPSHPLDHTPR